MADACDCVRVNTDCGELLLWAAVYLFDTDRNRPRRALVRGCDL